MFLLETGKFWVSGRCCQNNTAPTKWFQWDCIKTTTSSINATAILSPKEKEMGNSSISRYWSQPQMSVTQSPGLISLLLLNRLSLQRGMLDGNAHLKCWVICNSRFQDPRSALKARRHQTRVLIWVSHNPSDESWRVIVAVEFLLSMKQSITRFWRQELCWGISANLELKSPMSFQRSNGGGGGDWERNQHTRESVGFWT
jgi:hypothetical protein